MLTVGVGYTVILNVMGVPAQPSSDGITVIMPVISALVALAGAVHDGIFPEPEVPSPMAVLLLVHVYVVPGILAVNAGMLIRSPGQTATDAMGFATGVGKTVTVKLTGLPVQPFDDVGVMVIVPIILAPVVLGGAVQEAILPVPEETSPISVLLFAQE